VEDVFDFVRANPRAAHAPLEGWVQRDAAAGLVKSAGLDFDALKKQAQTRDFKPVELQGVTFSADVPIKVESAVSHNVVGILPGKRHANETVLYTAHWDHLGVGVPDAKGDRIYNGAVDNASGVSLLIELARAFGKAPRTDRSVVFIATTGEEKLFLGTDYYVANPLYPLETTVADLNMDGMNVLGRSRNVSAAGDVPLTLLDRMVEVAAKHRLAYTPESHPEYGSYFRNDHFPFARVGVPAITFGGGGDLEKGGAAASERAYQEYKRDKYHQPADEYDPDWDLGGMVQEAEVFYDLGRVLANSREWPEWKPGAEFKAIRDASNSARK
jgi:Zn-dependent M28 family amino/carboxypeptidase